MIRLATSTDAAAIAGIYRPYVEGSRVSFEETAPDASEMSARMTGPLHPWLVAEENGRVLGYASSSPYHRRPAYRWTVETSIYLAREAQGRGLGGTLLSSLIELLTRQGYVTAIAAIALPNPVSIALHERLGFAPAGTLSRRRFQARPVDRRQPLATRPRAAQHGAARAPALRPDQM
jgi:L-amino acid N-acyltransferase YncA